MNNVICSKEALPACHDPVPLHLEAQNAQWKKAGRKGKKRDCRKVDQDLVPLDQISRTAQPHASHVKLHGRAAPVVQFPPVSRSKGIKPSMVLYDGNKTESDLS